MNKIEKMFACIWILLFGNLIQVGKAQSYESVTNLRSTLLNASYNPDVLPLSEQSDTLNINLTTFVFMISEVDLVQGAITMGIMITQEWYDERLNWTPADHNGITTISIKSEEVWTPPLTLSNPVKFLMLDKSWMQVMYMNDGKATYTVGEIIMFTCSFYMKFWPFDKQECSMNFFVYGYAASRLTLSVPGTVVNTDYYSKNGEWYLDENSFEYSIANRFGMSEVKYSFKIARLPGFYLLTIILPINGIGALTCLVFLLPSESGERVSYSITIMLSLAVFLTIVSEDMPKNSEPVPVICLYILFNMLVCICSLIIVILNLILYHRRDSVTVSKYYKAVVRLSCCRWCANKVDDGSKQCMTDLRDGNALDSDENQKDKKISRKIFVSPQTFVSDDSENVLGTDDSITWKEVSEAIDKLLFCALIVLTYIPSITVLIYISAASDYHAQ